MHRFAEKLHATPILGWGVMEKSAMAKKANSDEERRPDPKESTPRSPRRPDGNDQRESESEPEQENKSQDGDTVNPEKEH